MYNKSIDTSSHKNVVLDFTISKSNDLVAGQPVAILPAELCKRLLKTYSDQLVNATPELIINAHINDLRDCITIDAVMIKSIEFIQERELITNCVKENWDYYSTVGQTIPVVQEKTKHSFTS